MTSIMVGVDGSESSAMALQWAAREADVRGVPITAVMAWSFLDQHHVPVGEGFDPGYGEPEAIAALRAYVEQAVGPLIAASVEMRAVNDLPARALLEASSEAALLVVGARGLGGFRGLLLGSVSQQSLHHATCPVAIIRQGQRPTAGDDTERIVVGIDTSEAARQALKWAVDEARLRRAALQVVHAWHLPFVGAAPLVPPSVAVEDFEDAVRRFLDEAVDGLDADGMARPVEGILVSGGAASAILEAAKGAGLVVVGSRGHGGFRGLLLGSVSQHIAHHATCPAVIVPAGGQDAVGDDD